MVSKESRDAVRKGKHRRIRSTLRGTALRPRLAVFRSNKNMYAQIIDDEKGETLVCANTLQKDVSACLQKTDDTGAAKAVGTFIARRAMEKGISEVVFDRGGYIYHGKVRSLAEAAREEGLKF